MKATLTGAQAMISKAWYQRQWTAWGFKRETYGGGRFDLYVKGTLKALVPSPDSLSDEQRWQALLRAAKDYRLEPPDEEPT